MLRIWCFSGCLQSLCQNNLFWNTSFQSVLRQNHFYWLATNKIYWFCRCLRLKNGDALAKGRICGQFLKTVRNMTTFWDFSATWLFSVAPQFVQALSVLFSSGCSWLSSCYCSHCLGLVCDWCVWDSGIAKKTFHVWICLVLGIFCALPRLRCLLRILSSCFLPTWGPTGLNLSSSLPFGRFRPLTTSFFKIVQFWEYSRLFSIIFNIFRLLSITLEYSRLLSITLDYSRLLSITLSIALDYSRLLSLTLAYSRLLSRLLSIIFWCFLHTSMVSWLFFDYGAFVFQSGSTSFEERHLRGNPGFQTLLWTSKMSKSHPLSLFSVASQHLTVVLTFFCFCLRFFLSHPWWSSPTPANEVMNEQMTPPTATWQVNSLCFSSILGVTTSLWGGEFLQNTWGFPKRAWNRPKTA